MSTAMDSGTSDRNASQSRNSAANAPMPTQTQTSFSIAVQRATIPRPGSAVAAAFNERWPTVTQKRFKTQMSVASGVMDSGPRFRV